MCLCLSHCSSDIRSFKNFLDSILYDEDEHLKKERQTLLKEYLDSQKPKHEDHVFLRDLEQAWSFASQIHNDSLFSSITAVLALLFRVISSFLDLRDHGFLLARMILQFNQIKLVSRGLSAPTHKEFVISPCLRLLTEITSFDAGALGRQLYAKRDFTFDTKIITRNLHHNKTDSENAEDDSRRKQSVRATAVRYLLAHLKYQEEGVKIDILRNGNIVRALFSHLKEDPHHIAKDILAVVKSNILLDDSLPRQTKSQVMTDRTLADVAALYRSDEGSEVDGLPIDKIAHEFLLLVCTKFDLGVYLSTSGWYPPGTERETAITSRSSLGSAGLNGDHPERARATASDGPGNDEQLASAINLGLDSIEWYNGFQKEVPVRNVVLASFIQGLRPYSNNLERELLITIFNTAPELVADYFFKKKSFQFDPKLTVTWIGYAAVLFETVHLSVPPFFGRRTTYHTIPPPLSIAIESVLPQPLSQRVLKNCLNSRSYMITFFTIRILILSFEKLGHVLRMFKDAEQERGNLWNQAAARLVQEFYNRCPSVRDIITVFQQTPKSNLTQREAVTRLLAQCFQITPSMARDEKFDIASVLAEALQSLENDEAEPETRQMRLLELSHLVTIARLSPDMRWFNKPQILRFSPFVILLKLVVQSASQNTTSAIRELMLSIVKEHGIIQTETPKSSLDVLVRVLSGLQNPSARDAVFDFLDDCVQRLVRRPLKYLDDLDALEQETATTIAKEPRPVSMILVPVLEQWAFVPGSRPNEAYDIGRLIDAYLTMSERIGEDDNIISILRRKFLDIADKSELDRSQLIGASLIDNFGIEEAHQPEEAAPGKPILQPHITENDAVSGAQVLAADAPPTEPESHSELLRWVHKDIDSIVEENLAGALVLCLCSTQLSIRKEALINTRKLAAKFLTSSHPEKDQLHLLLLETAETAAGLVDTAPLSYIAGVFAAHAATILAEPTHFLYPKINNYLNKGPMWNADRIPAYWIEQILLHPPEEDDARQKEIGWLIDFLFDAVRTQREMEIYRRRSVFEHVLALYGAPFTTREVKGKVLGLMRRATWVDGASTTLITRVGVVSWLDGRIAARDGDVAAMRRLRARILDTCDKKRIAEWSAGLLVKSEVSESTLCSS